MVGVLPAATLKVLDPPVSPTPQTRDLYGPARMIVDPIHHLGFAPEFPQGSGLPVRVAVYDLQRLSLLKVVDMPVPGDSLGYGETDHSNAWTLDAEGGRLLIPVSSSASPACAVNPGQLQALRYEQVRPDGPWTFTTSLQTLPCLGPPGAPLQGFGLRGTSFDPGSKKLYVIGVSGIDQSRQLGGLDSQFTATYDNDGSTILVGQMSLAGAAPSFDWMVDLRSTGCGRARLAFVQRAGDSVLSYCYDTRPWAGSAPASETFGYYGQQGYVVRIPLVRDPHGVDRPTLNSAVPVIDPTTGALLDAAIVRTSSLGGPVLPLADPGSRDLLLATSGTGYGNAVWVFDVGADRFRGVVTGGFATQPVGNSAVGFDGTKGRAYLLTVKGLLAVPTRQRPPGGGQLYEGFLANDHLGDHDSGGSFVSSDSIAVDPGLNRLFIPISRPQPCPPPIGPGGNCKGYAVIEDRTSDVVPRTVPPRELTDDIPEQAGVTETAASGAVSATGARMIVVGGVPRSIDTNDPLCSPILNPDPSNLANKPSVVEPTLFDGSCLADQVFASGNHDASMAVTGATASTDSGSHAAAAGIAFDSNDTATDADLRRLGRCAQHIPENVASSLARQMSQNGGDSGSQGAQQFQSGSRPFFDGVATACAGVQDGMTSHGGPDVRAGTRGPRGDGFPTRGVECIDDGSNPGAKSQPTPDGSAPGNALSTAVVSCSQRLTASSAASSLSGLALLSGAPPRISVGEVSSSISSIRVPAGQLTTAEARARSVVIGDVTIGEVRSVATTLARGRRDEGNNRSYAVFERWWCDVRGAGVAITGCFNPSENQELIDTINRKVGRIRVSLPPVSATKSDHGYQAVVVKDPDEQRADLAVNDDGAVTVPGLEVVVYNDGSQGRSRLVVQLASVHAESRLGITRLPVLGELGVLPPDLPTGPDGLTVFKPVGDAGLGTSSFGSSPQPRVVPVVAAGVVPASRVGPVNFPRSRLPGPLGAISDAIRLLVNNPRQFALLLALWSLLATPVYLFTRRRAFTRAVEP